MTVSIKSRLQWQATGRQIFPAMLAAISAAQKSIEFETYIYGDDRLGGQFLTALLAAAKRGLRVRVLVDAVGSWLISRSYFSPLIAAGADVRVFNPLHLWRFSVRDHRKLLVCDGRVVFVGGFNVSDEYDGDGVEHGWFDLGVRLENPAMANELTSSFDELFALADFHRKPLLRLWAFKRRPKIFKKVAGELLLSRPGRGASAFQLALYQDLAAAREVQIISAYFLPTRRVRAELIRVIRRGGRVQLILAGKSDVLVSQLATRSLYRRLLKAGVEIYEYQPQILHAKLVLCDDVVFTGSSNLDIRSLNLNYELMLRCDEKPFVAEGRQLFAEALKHCKKIEWREWQATQTYWQRWRNHWAHFLLARIDPFVALRQFRTME